VVYELVENALWGPTEAPPPAPIRLDRLAGAPNLGPIRSPAACPDGQLAGCPFEIRRLHQVVFSLCDCEYRTAVNRWCSADFSA